LHLLLPAHAAATQVCTRWWQTASTKTPVTHGHYSLLLVLLLVHDTSSSVDYHTRCCCRCHRHRSRVPFSLPPHKSFHCFALVKKVTAENSCRPNLWHQKRPRRPLPVSSPGHDGMIHMTSSVLDSSPRFNPSSPGLPPVFAFWSPGQDPMDEWFTCL
jgi:hypothetical protein